MKNKWMKQIKWVICSYMVLLFIMLLSQNYEAKAATKSVTVGTFDTVSIFDMKSSELKNLSVASSKKDVKVKKKTYTDNGVKHTAVLAWAPYSGGDKEEATVTIKYYDIKKRKNVTVKKQTNFVPDYNGGYETEQTIALNADQRYIIRGSAKLKSIYNSLDRYESSMFAPFSGLGDGKEICTVTSSMKNKTFRIFADGYGKMGCYLAAYFINGEITVYKFNITVPSEDGSIFTREMKLVKGESTVLYFTPPESGRLSVQTGEEEIVSAELTENQDTKEAALILTGLNKGKTEVSLVYDTKGKPCINKYIINVVEQSPTTEEVLLTPTEENHSYACSYQLTDSCGNLLRVLPGTQHMEVLPDSSEVSVEYYTEDYVTLKFFAPGTYHVEVNLKNLDGSVVQNYMLTVTAGKLDYKDKEEITFTTEADAKAFFCGEAYRIWSSGEYTISFHDNNVITAIWASNPWFLKSGDYAPGDATYSFDIKQQKIIVKDYDRTLELSYEIITKDHVRLTIEGKTRDFIKYSME